MQKKMFNKILVTIVCLCLLGYGFIGTDPYLSLLLVTICFNCLLAASLRVVMEIGEINLAHAGFYGMGAYMSAFLTMYLKLPFLLAIFLSGCFVGVIGLAFGSIALRLKGAYFLLVSFALAEIIKIIFSNMWENTLGGASGLTNIPTPFAMFKGVVVVTTLILLLVLYYLEKSKIGSIYKAIQQSEALSKSIGISTMRYKVSALGLSSFCVGMTGSLFAHYNKVISPGDFSTHISFIALAFVIIGGRRNFAGPIVGAIVLTLLSEYIRGLGSYTDLVYGIAIILCMLLLPDGVVGGYKHFISVSKFWKKDNKGIVKG